jgi:hypothetical protein
MLAEAVTALASTGGTALVTSTKITVEWIDYLVGLRNGLSAAPSGCVPKVSVPGWTAPHNCPTVLLWPR